MGQTAHLPAAVDVSVRPRGRGGGGSPERRGREGGAPQRATPLPQAGAPRGAGAQGKTGEDHGLGKSQVYKNLGVGFAAGVRTHFGRWEGSDIGAGAGGVKVAPRTGAAVLLFL